MGNSGAAKIRRMENGDGHGIVKCLVLIGSMYPKSRGKKADSLGHVLSTNFEGEVLSPLAVMDRNASNNVEPTKVDDEFIEHVHDSYPGLTPEDANFMRAYEGRAGKKVIRKVCSNSSPDATQCVWTLVG